MKIRNGFVSNSSSSSFIIGLDKKPKSIEDVEKAFFPNKENVRADYYDDCLSSLIASQKIWHQLEGQKPLTEKKIIEEIRNGYYDGHPSYDEYTHYWDEVDDLRKQYKTQTNQEFFDWVEGKSKPNKPINKKLYDKISKKIQKIVDDKEKFNRKRATEYYNSVKHIIKNKKVFVLSFADNGGEGIMEHGNAFDNVPHITISHH